MTTGATDRCGTNVREVGKVHFRPWIIAAALALGPPGVNRKEGMKMTRVRVEGFTISLDGYGAGPNQDIRNPLGVGGTDLHQWLVPTRTFQRTLFGADGGTTGIDDDFAARGFKNVGACQCAWPCRCCELVI